MAAPLLNRVTLVRLPPRAVGERAFAEHPVLQVLAQAVEGHPPVWSATSLEAMPAVRRVVLVLDARDVTLFTLKLPPLPARRLLQAVPNLVEDLLLQDPQACAIAPGPEVDEGRRLIAVADKGWLARAVEAFERRGMRVEAVWPAQLTLPLQPGAWSIEVNAERLVLRTGACSGFGWALPGAEAERETAITAALEAARTDGGQPERLDVVGPSGPEWRAPLTAAAERLGLTLGQAEPGAVPAPVDLLAALGSRASTRWVGRIDPRAWRIPAWVFAACAAVWVVGLNLDWTVMAREHTDLRARMERTFRETFPGTQVVIDPVLQMQRRLTELRQGAGRSGSSDLMPLLTRFADALGDQGVDALVALEYRDGRLKARARAGLLEGADRQEALRAACLQRGLVVEFTAEAGATTVLIRAGS